MDGFVTVLIGDDSCNGCETIKIIVKGTAPQSDMDNRYLEISTDYYTCELKDYFWKQERLHIGEYMYIYMMAWTAECWIY